MNPPWLDSLGVFGWREIVLLLATLLTLYVLIAYLRLRRIGRPQPPATQPPPSATPVPPPPADAPPPAAVTPPTLQETAKPPPPEVGPEPEELPWVRTPVQRDEQRRLEVIESEIVSMRSQIESLSETVALLVEQLRQEYAHEQHEHQHAQVEVTPAPLMPASPLYGDAMQLALAGHDATSIAERCGIARAEAELVVALAQQDSDKINTTEHGGGDDGGKGRY